MIGYIYKTTYLGDKRIYIGQRQGKFKQNYLGSGKHLRLAIGKYGRENFWVELLAYADSQEQLDDLEKYYIQLYRNAFGIEKLFNISSGGRTQRSFIGKLNPMYGSYRIGKLNPNWRNNACSIKYYCKDCKTQISRGATRCKSCVGKATSHPNFIRTNAPWNKNKQCPSISEGCKGRIPWNKGLKLVEGKWK
jgi:hypothetical protein